MNILSFLHASGGIDDILWKFISGREVLYWCNGGSERGYMYVSTFLY